MGDNSPVTILLCEDDRVIRELYRKILENKGYRVIAAADGRDAIEIFNIHGDEIRLLIIDVMMPNKNGRVAFEEIRKAAPWIKVIFNSGYFSDVTKRLQEEGYHYLQKPYAPELLLKKIGEVLAEEQNLGVSI